MVLENTYPTRGFGETRTMTRDGHISVYVTTGSEDEARTIARTVVEEGLAACANIFPVYSIYRWEGRVEDDTEFAMILKTTAGRFMELERRILAIHTYDVPCITRWDITGGHHPYLQWVTGCTTPSTGTDTEESR